VSASTPSAAGPSLATGPGRISDFTSSIRIRLREPARLRNIELPLLLFAIGLSIGAMALVQLGAQGQFDEGMLALPAALGGLALVGHIILRVTAPNADPFLLPIATVLNGIGIAEISRLDIAEHRLGWDALGVKQVVFSAIAMVLAFIVLAAFRNVRVLSRYRYIAMFVGIALLLLPMAFKPINGAQVWVTIAGINFQPGELAKIALAIFFAGYLVTARDSLSIIGRKLGPLQFPRARDLGPILIVWVVAMGVLVVQRDLGTSLLYFGLFLVMIYVATARLSWVVLGMTLFIGGALIASQTLGYVNGRFVTWLDAFSNEQYRADRGSFQVVQGLFGLADGGLIGTGLGQGRPDIVPIAESDFIIPSLGEELGLIGLFAILGLYLLMVSRGLRIGHLGDDDFGRLLGVGLSFVIALQTFIVVGGVTRVIPLTGLTTPFLAAGGSSLVANWIIVALLLRLSDGIRPARFPGGLQ
jgi:cell division protein FtsW (lipid II flippase)